MLPKPYSNCELDTNINSEYYNLIKANGYAYSQKLCIEQCIQKKILTECGCIDSSIFTFYSFERMCDSNETMYECYLKVFYREYSNDKENEACEYKCPLEQCSEELF